MDKLHRVSVVGVTGSGKTTFARWFAGIIGAPHVELDSLHWEPNWTEAPTEIFRGRVDRALHGDRWVVDGNYSKVRDIVWARADTIVWLDYSLPIILWQLTRRTVRRLLRQEELWSGNRESLRTHLFTRDSLFLWALQTYPRHKREYPTLFKQPEYAHLTLVYFRSPRAADRWLASLRRAGPENANGRPQ